MIASTASTTTVLAVVLVAIGLVMIGTTVWLVRSTRRDAPALGPLEVMGDRRFTKAAPDARLATLEGARPPGAPPPAPMVPFDDAELPAAVEVPAEVVESVPAPEPDVVEPEPVDAEVEAEPVDAEAVVESEPVDAGVEAVVVEPDVEVDPTTEVTGPEDGEPTELVEPEVVEIADPGVEDVDIGERVPAPEAS